MVQCINIVDHHFLGGHHGALISARDIDLTLSGDLNNSGTIAGRKLVDISAQNLNNSGYLQGDIALLNAQQDINLDGGQIAANTGMALQAGGDINIASTLHSHTNEVGDNTFSLQGIDRVAGLYVNGEAGTLLASAGGAINLTAAQLHNLGSGATQLTAGSDITLDTLEIGQRHALNWDANNYHHQSHSEEIGSVITGGGAVSLTAGQDIHLRAATVDAQGALALNAIGGDINVAAGQRTNSLAEGRQTRSSGLFSSRTRTTRTSSDSTHALASELGGQTVSLISGQDIRVSGANIVADQDLGLHAGGNLTLNAEQHTLSDSHFSHSKRSGLFSGGLGINLGSQRQMTDATNTATFVAPTTVGSIGGNVTLTAGDSYTQIGSDVLAPSGDILIGANTVNILEGRETTRHQTEQRFKQSGLSLSLSNPVMDTAQGLQRQANAASDTQSTRMHALAAANTALAVKDIQQQITNGNAATDLSLNIGLGTSQRRSQSTAASNTARGSTLTAGGNLAIHALGQEDGEGTITVQGSQLAAGNQLQLNAAQDIHLLASADSASQRSSHRSSSGSIGLGVGTKGLALNLDANRAQGHGNGDSTTYTNTQLSAGSQVILTSGGDTALKGAVVSAPQITTHIGGKLTIESLQDSATHNERHSSSGASLSVPLIGAGLPTASLDASRTKINSDTQSVNEQSGLRADDGGFQVNVGGTTHLNGGAITSTQVAIDEDRNTFTTAGQSASEALQSGALTLSDIGNNATFDAESLSVGLSSGGNNSGESNTGLSGIGTGRDDGSASSTTVAAISGLAGNQDARTGDAESGLAPIFDADRVKRDVQAQATITQEFGSRASQWVGDIAQAKVEEAQLKRLQAQQAQAAGDNERAAQLNAQADQLQSDWGENGTKRLAAHTAIGALTGGTQGATGAAVGTLSAPAVANALKNAGLDDTLTNGLTALASTATGAATGGTQGATAAFNEVVNNYLTTRALNEELERLTAEDSELEPELRRQLVEHQLLSGLQENAPLDDCRVVGSDCSPQLDEITATFELLQDPNTREQLGGDLTDALIERQLNDLVATLESVDWSQDPDTIARAEAIGSVTRTFVDACALHPLAGPCRGVAVAITSSDVVEKASDGDLTGAFVQGGAFVAGQSTASIVKGSIQKTGVYSKEFIEWTRNIYGAGTEKVIQWIYDETQSVPDTDDE
ncbi:hemagglutinin repeat-containing protein [Vreelandella zhaodongensis]|uniref:hemagglutinin repeat-containing protein n=1 Tax=Vreelandella zhaodongensis TaxID=1176240 RepID=UPI003EBB5D47